MNTSTKQEIAKMVESSSNSALVTLDPVQYVAEIYAPFRVKFDAAKIVSDAIIVDCTTPAGNNIAIAQRAIFRDGVRLAVGAARTERKAPILIIGRLIDSEAAKIVEESAPYEAKYDDAIKAQAAKIETEKALKIADEMERIREIRARIEKIRAWSQTTGMSHGEISAAISILANLTPDDSFDEFQAQANEIWAITLDEMAKAEAIQKNIEIEAEHRRQEVARAVAEYDTAVAQLATYRAEMAEQKRLAKIEADRVAAATKAQLEAQQVQIAQDRIAQEWIAQQERDDCAAEVTKFRAEQAAHAAREAEFQAQKDAHAAEIKAAADALALQAKIDVDHIEALADDLEFDSDIAEDAARQLRLAELIANANIVDADFDERENGFDVEWKDDSAVPAPTLRLGQICSRLGFSLSANFLRTMGFEPAARDKAAQLYHEHDFGSICEALVRHIDLARAEAA